METEKSSFEDLKDQIIDPQLCLFCGACVAVCPVNCLEFGADGPTQVADCNACGLCLPTCPGAGAPHAEFDRVFLGRPRTEEEDRSGFGICAGEYNLISGDDEIHAHGYTGGKLTAVLEHLLRTGKIDAAIVSTWGEASPFPWFAWPAVATDRSALLTAAGSKYVFSPNLLALKEIAQRDDIQAVAFVGLGCHIQGLRKMMIAGKPYARLTRKVKYLFGLYCGAPMVERDNFMQYVAELTGVSADKIKAVDFKRVSEEFDVAFEVVDTAGEVTRRTINLLELFGILAPYPRWPRCSLCTDYSAEFADISFGGVHVTTRTQVGEEIVQNALAENVLTEYAGDQNFQQMAAQLDVAMAGIKKGVNRRTIEERLKEGKPAPIYT